MIMIPIRTIFALTPPDAPQWIYTKLLRPKPLRAIGNACLRAIIPETLIIPEGALCLNPDDPVVSGALALGAYEPYFTEEFRRHIPQGGVVVDIGANLGYYTLIASKSARMVIAYEPEKENLRFLKRTIALNQLTNVRVIEKGLGALPGNLVLTLDPDNKGKHTLLSGVTGDQAMIPITTLDASLCAEHFTQVDLIKMDIEGWEAHALRGMRETLERMHPIIFFEYAPARIRASGESGVLMLETLRNFGYTLFLIDEAKKTLRMIDDFALFSATLPDKESYANILAKKVVLSPTP